ncbi:Os08g0448700 [Oryza sativa Japonica Group]|uniref:Os08g0448700 protein n=1 Tax=Oryza sativa subsp. japonica TaxID=39947 RepID=A0A0P0XGU5_ORYSJ|nr:Os08g0448700 [Oryza sativa Japonica Group]
MIEAHGHHKQAQTFVDMHVRPELPRESLSGDVREALPGLHRQRRRSPADAGRAHRRLLPPTPHHRLTAVQDSAPAAAAAGQIRGSVRGARLDGELHCGRTRAHEVPLKRIPIQRQGRGRRVGVDQATMACGCHQA